MTILLALILIVVAYLLGSTSSAIIISKIMGLPDPRSEGSNNPGATNVLRLGGKKAAAIVLFLDVLKGILPIILSHIYQMSNPALACIGLAAVIGHVFPLYYQFKGGKGVATTLGVFYGLNVFFGLFCTAVWLISLRLSHYSSLSSLIMIGLAPIAALVFFQPWLTALPLVLMALLIAQQHKENIQRLINHTESKTTLFSKET